ncbi:hypothetical protein ISREJYDI_CDS0033 [Pseudomonas phage UNO-G1W1]|uniref:Tail fiber protein n=1 Tax=Pseudomonas phage UNO-G1W1 TaxID=3136609 RepID=A0AAX4QNE9_9CAUD
MQRLSSLYHRHTVSFRNSFDTFQCFVKDRSTSFQANNTQRFKLVLHLVGCVAAGYNVALHITFGAVDAVDGEVRQSQLAVGFLTSALGEDDASVVAAFSRQQVLHASVGQVELDPTLLGVLRFPNQMLCSVQVEFDFGHVERTTLSHLFLRCVRFDVREYEGFRPRCQLLFQIFYSQTTCSQQALQFQHRFALAMLLSNSAHDRVQSLFGDAFVQHFQKDSLKASTSRGHVLNLARGDSDSTGQGELTLSILCNPVTQHHFPASTQLLLFQMVDDTCDSISASFVDVHNPLFVSQSVDGTLTVEGYNALSFTDFTNDSGDLVFSLHVVLLLDSENGTDDKAASDDTCEVLAVVQV